MRYLPFIIISLILYTLFFYNNQDPELLTVSDTSSEKVVPIDFDLSDELNKKTALEEKPSQTDKTLIEEQPTVLVEKTIVKEKPTLDESNIEEKELSLIKEVNTEEQQASVEEKTQIVEQAQLAVASQSADSTTTVVAESPAKTENIEPLSAETASEEVTASTIETVKVKTQATDLPEELATDIKNSKQIEQSANSSIAIESALLKGEYYQANLLTNLPPLPVKKKTALAKNNSKTKKTTTKASASPQKREVEQASLSSVLLNKKAGNTSQTVPNFTVTNKSDKPKRTFKKQVKSTPAPAIPGLQVAIAVSGNKPQYPEKAKANKLQGTVTARFIVNTQGKTKNAQVINSSSHKELDNALLEFVEQERFMPALDGIEKITSEQQLSFKYEPK